MTEKAKLREALERDFGLATSHYMHHDPTGGAGSGCAACHAAGRVHALFRAHLDSLAESEPGEDEPSDAEVAVSYLAGLARRSGNGTHIDDALATVRAALRAAAGPDASDARRVAFEEYLRGERSATSFCAAMKIADVLAMEAADERPFARCKEGGDA